MADNKISLPSGRGGLTSFGEDLHSKIRFEPGHIIVLCVIVIVVMIFLHVLY